MVGNGYPPKVVVRSLRKRRTSRPSSLELAARDRNWRQGRVEALRVQAQRLLFNVFGARSTSLYRVVEGLCKLLTDRVEKDFASAKATAELSATQIVEPTQDFSITQEQA